METVEHNFKNIFIKNQFVAALLLVLVGWFLLQIKEILILFFIAYILMAALMPYVRILHRHKVPRVVASGIVYFGDEIGKRQILSGIKKFFTPEELIGKQALFIVNLEPRTMMGLESQGMLLAVDNENGPVLLSPLEKVPNGAATH